MNPTLVDFYISDFYISLHLCLPHIVKENKSKILLFNNHNVPQGVLAQQTNRIKNY